MKNKEKIILSCLLIFNVSIMFLDWFGGCRGVQGIKGIIILYNPLTIICFIAVYFGIWKDTKIYNKALTLVGLCGICAVEVYYFLTWYIETITGEFDLAFSFEMAYPEFYIGFSLTLVSLILYLIFSKISNKYTFD